MLGQQDARRLCDVAVELGVLDATSCIRKLTTEEVRRQTKLTAERRRLLNKAGENNE